MKALAAPVITLISRLLQASIVSAAWIMMLCIVIQVVMRYVFGRAPSWTEEGAMLMFSWAILGGLALGVNQGFHVRLDLIIGSVPLPMRRWAERAIDAFTMSFGAYLLWSGERYYSMTGGSVSAAIGYPIEILHILAPVCGALIFLFATARLLGVSQPEAETEIAP
ncbi:TRAP transporter small permease [Mesorhizobium sp. CAU 1732]|uniref:TRAP transporter small permease n=1 Tax=Mesorhizobium sp. CAU 1732 TaxID=3140358 RepID=UPI0032613A60